MNNRYGTIVIGGGIMGAAVVYSLAVSGHEKTLLLERNFPASGATSKAATLISMARGTAEIIPYVKETWRQIDILAAGDTESLGIRRVGAVHVASSSDGIDGLKKIYQTSCQNGVSGWEIEPRQVRDMLPWINKKKILMAYFYGDEGFVDGYLLTTAYLAAAKKSGADVFLRCAVTAIAPIPEGGYEVKTERGVFQSRNVVIAAGAWSNLLLEPLGASIPFAPVRSQYWMTGNAPELFPPRQPVCILSDAHAYTRPENGALVFGWREPDCVYVDPHELPFDVLSYRFPHDPEGWDNLEGCVNSLEKYFPDIAEQGISRYVSGCSTYTPDGLFNVGEIAGFPSLYAVAGCCGMGIAVCGGIGRAVAEYIVKGETELPTARFSPNRFMAKNAFSKKFMRSCAAARSNKKTG